VALLTAGLVDGHCHPVLAGDIDRARFELALSEADLPHPLGVLPVDSQLGLAVRRWCSPALDLPAHTGVDEYLARRAELGWSAVSRRLLERAGLDLLLVDTGLDRPGLVDRSTLGDLAAAPTREVVRLERVAEDLAGEVGAADFADAYAQALAERVREAIAIKSIIAYRYGLDLPAQRPSSADVTRAAGDWLRAGGRLTDPVLLCHILWAGVDTGLPLQLHSGFGDRDLVLARSDPALAQPFVDATRTAGVSIVFLHTYPYHRSAGWLAQVYPHVSVDIGLTVHHLGHRADVVLAEFLELAPFGKVLYSSDAYELPELYLVGAAQFRHSLSRLLDAWVADDAMSRVDADRVAEQIAAGNARRLYRLAGQADE
jgi:predicted TIM-barrel fold metal-dependent hydrolase